MNARAKRLKTVNKIQKSIDFLNSDVTELSQVGVVSKPFPLNTFTWSVMSLVGNNYPINAADRFNFWQLTLK